jgi:hypothetical protein
MGSTGAIGGLPISMRASPTPLKARLANSAAQCFAGSPTDFGKLIVEEIEKWAKAIKFAEFKPD